MEDDARAPGHICIMSGRRVRQFEYTWLRAAAGSYRDFRAVTEGALAYASRATGIRLSGHASRTLVGAYDRREEIAFAAFGGWDAAGAKSFGYPTFWLNRLGVPAEELSPGPDAVGSTLTEVAAWAGAQ